MCISSAQARTQSAMLGCQGLGLGNFYCKSTGSCAMSMLISTAQGHTHTKCFPGFASGCAVLCRPRRKSG